MREVGKDLKESRITVETLKGVPLVVRLDEGRGKLSLFECRVTKMYPSVFSVETDDGLTRTFSYSDVQIGKIKFLKK